MNSHTVRLNRQRQNVIKFKEYIWLIRYINHLYIFKKRNCRTLYFISSDMIPKQYIFIFQMDFFARKKVKTQNFIYYYSLLVKILLVDFLEIIINNNQYIECWEYCYYHSYYYYSSSSYSSVTFLLYPIPTTCW